VIERLAVNGDLAERFPCIDRGLVDGLGEVGFADVMRAAKGGEKAVGVEQFQRAEVELFVAAEGIVQLPLGAGEGGWVEDDKIPARFGLLLRAEEIEGIGLDGFDCEVVAFRVGPDEGGRVGADLDGLHRTGAGLGAGEGEGALIGKAIEHFAAFGVCRHGGVVLELIEVEAGLLAVEEIHLKAQTHGLDLEWSGLSAGEHATCSSIPSALRMGASFRSTMARGWRSALSASAMMVLRWSIARVSVCSTSASP